MSENSKTLTSPLVDMLYSVLRTAKTPKYTKPNGEALDPQYSTKNYVKGSTPGAAEFKAALKKINRDLVITEDRQGNSLVEDEGDFIFNARSDKDHPPTVYSPDGARLLGDEIPMLGKGSQGKIIMTVFEGKGPGQGGIGLKGVQLTTIVEHVAETISDEEMDALAARARNS